MVRKPALAHFLRLRLFGSETKRRNKGVTLIEIIIVVSAIIALAILLLWTFQTQALKGRDARRKADLDLIRKALEDYYNDHGCYPPASALDCEPGTGLQPYLTKVPCDPITGESYAYDPGPGVCPGEFKLYTSLETIPLGGCGPGSSYNYGVASPNTTITCGSVSGIYACYKGACKPVGDPNLCPATYNDPGCYGNCTNPANNCDF